MTKHTPIGLYMLKCCCAALLVYAARPWLPANDDNWVWFFISMILVQSPDSAEAIPLALTRIQANIVASFFALLALLVGLSGPIAMCAAFCASIAFCYWRNMMQASRAALAAIIIILLHPEGQHLWDAALERGIYVVSGCLAGLAITIPFHWQSYRALLQRRGKSHDMQGEA